MKFLFVIRVMLRDWLTVHRRYTAIIILTMILSVQALFFVAVKNANESMGSIFTEKYYGGTYDINPSVLGEKDPEIFTDAGKNREYNEKFPFSEYLCKRETLDAYLDSGLPMPFANKEIPAVSGDMVIQMYKLNGVPWYEFGDGILAFEYLYGIPAFEDADSRYEPVMNCSVFDYMIVEGRDYTENDLTSHARVLVVPDSLEMRCGVPVKPGDRLGCGKYEFEVIGVSHSESFPDHSRLPFWYAEECMSEYLGSRETQYKPGHVTDLGGYDSWLRLQSLSYEHPLSRSQKQTLCEVLGLPDSAVFMGYEDHLSKQYDEFLGSTVTECTVFGLFCIANIILAVWSLCQKHITTLRTFRVYGASNGAVTRLIVVLIMCITLAAGVIGGLLCIPMQKLYESINPSYAWRPYCMYIAVGALLVINLIAAVPTAILTVRRSPIEK
ncbi:MAG: hypothetical protein IKP47_02925 [Ruminococcus sp.]|nr:hypothetical protein [Ruminococcus sp.]